MLNCILNNHVMCVWSFPASFHTISSSVHVGIKPLCYTYMISHIKKFSIIFFHITLWLWCSHSEFKHSARVIVYNMHVIVFVNT